MNTPIACLLIAGLMPILWTATAKVLGARERRFNNRDTRGWQAGLQGAAARAHAAHLNSFEAFPLFAAAVLVTMIAGADDAVSTALMIAFVLLRLTYGICYVADWPSLRSLVWLLALASNVWLLFRAW
jgi:uncharacterized MAPEG superfamily protein